MPALQRDVDDGAAGLPGKGREDLLERQRVLGLDGMQGVVVIIVLVVAVVSGQIVAATAIGRTAIVRTVVVRNVVI